jgi:hypothetical protein
LELASLSMALKPATLDLLTLSQLEGMAPSLFSSSYSFSLIYFFPSRWHYSEHLAGRHANSSTW